MQIGRGLVDGSGKHMSGDVLKSWAVGKEREALAEDAAKVAAEAAAAKVAAAATPAAVRDEKGRWVQRGGVAAAGGGGRPGASGNGVRMSEQRVSAAEILTAAGM
jgi:hypothetical protein